MNVSSKIITSFMPITDLLRGLSYPVCFIMIGIGILLIIVGNKKHGMDIMKYASIGYLAMQFLPSMMKILSDIGTTMAHAN